ncbi:MAG TPA: pyridoxal phosphate-dependent aminotransferase [Candidatus Krumholzibacteria bacterium]|nr:pyridoxal phosphate-dependent aminotransferase [Candidatus Krumholzibacteria bacterium]
MSRTTTRLSRMGASVQESATLRQAARVAALRAAGRRVFNFTVGEPDCDTPLGVRTAAHAAIDGGHTHYTPSAGTVDLRQAVAAYYTARRGVVWSSAQTIVSTGAKQVLWSALAACVEPGDEVVLLAPYWTSYSAYVAMLGGVPRVVRPPASRDFKACGDDLRAVLGPRTRALVFNNPVNPTGAVYSAEELQDLFEPLRHTDVVTISDEIYENLVFEGVHVSPVQVFPELQDRFVLVSGASKSFAMTGWRIGFGLGPEDLVRAMINLQSHMTGNASSISQRATLAALAIGSADLEPLRQHFLERRDLSVQILSTLPALRFVPPHATFYVFLDVEPFLDGGKARPGLAGVEALAEDLLETHGIAVVPGTAFDHDRGVRLSSTLPVAELRAGLGILVQALGERA